VTTLEKIPFLPIEMFKNHKVVDSNIATDLFFQSSGTTQMNFQNISLQMKTFIRKVFIKA
jgi:hypothetical protein